jgi:phosphoribosylamine---glycine ligase
MKIAVIGSGGREHAIAWSLAKDVGEGKIYSMPGNGGTWNNVAVDPMDGAAVERACADLGVELAVIGPEDPLAAGLADRLSAAGIRAFGPGRGAAWLEGSKIASKAFMRRNGVATADSVEYPRPAEALPLIEDWRGDLVVKYDGLAAGKGVFVCGSIPEARAAIEAIVARHGADASVLVERRLEGDEISILGVTDGQRVRLLVPSQDHKPLLDGDRGPNTGGMGAFCPVPSVDDALLADIERAVVTPTLEGLAREGVAYRGVLYFGVMVTADGPQLLEYNVRLGDPETEVVLPALESSLLELILASFDGELDRTPLRFSGDSLVDVVLASGGYPGDYARGLPIHGLDRVPEGAMVFHAGTRRDGDRVLTAGGRVLNVVGRGPDLDAAIARAYEAVSAVGFEGMCCRRDIGRRVWRTDARRG